MPASSSTLISASVPSLVTSVSPLFSMSSHGDRAMTEPGSGAPRFSSARAVATARFPPAESPMVVMSPGAIPASVSAQERGDSVLEAGGVRMLGRQAVVEDEGVHAECLGDVCRELAVTGSGADRESAAVGVEQHLGGVGVDRPAPDAGDAADDVLGVGDVRRAPRWAGATRRRCCGTAAW